MRSVKIPSTGRPTVVAAVALVVVLAACGQAATADPATGGEAGPSGAEAPVGRDLVGDGRDQPGSGGPGGGTSGDGALFELIEERIIKTGEVTLEVDSVAESMGRVRALASRLGGHVGGSQAGTLDDRATLTLRIPAERFDEALAALHELDAEVVAEATREEAVTDQVVDLRARIDNLRASEASYRALLERAERIEDVLAVQARLDSVRGEIEQLSAQLDNLEDRATLSTLTVTLVPRPAPVTAQAEAWNPGEQLERAVAALVGIGQGLFDGLIWFAVVWLPILLVLGIIGLAILRGVLEVRRRLPPVGGVPPASDQPTT